MKVTACCAIALAIATVGGAASADVLTFESVPNGFLSTASFTDGAYTIEWTGFEAAAGHPLACIPSCASDGTQAIYSFNNTSFTIHRTDNGVFSLFSLDAAQTFTGLNRRLDLFVTGTHADNTTAAVNFTTTPGGADTFSSYTLDSTFTGLISVTLTGGPYFPDPNNDFLSPDSDFSFDNVVVGTTAGVPESASWALMLAGFGLMGAVLRSGRRTAATLSSVASTLADAWRASP